MTSPEDSMMEREEERLAEALAPARLRLGAADVLRTRGRRGRVRAAGAAALVLAVMVGVVWRAGWLVGGSGVPVSPGPREIVKEPKAEPESTWMLASGKGKLQRGERTIDKEPVASDGQWVTTGDEGAVFKHHLGASVEIGPGASVRLGELPVDAAATAPLEVLVQAGTVTVRTAPDRAARVGVGDALVDVSALANCTVTREMGGKMTRTNVQIAEGAARVRGAGQESRLAPGLACEIGIEGGPGIPFGEMAMKSPLGQSVQVLEGALAGKSKVSVEQAMAMCLKSARPEDAGVLWNIALRLEGRARASVMAELAGMLGDGQSALVLPPGEGDEALEKLWEAIVARR